MKHKQWFFLKRTNIMENDIYDDKELNNLLSGYNIFSKETIEEVKKDEDEHGIKECQSASVTKEKPNSVQVHSHVVTFNCKCCQIELRKSLLCLVKFHIRNLISFYYKECFYIPFLCMLFLYCSKLYLCHIMCILISILLCTLITLIHFAFYLLKNRNEKQKFPWIIYLWFLYQNDTCSKYHYAFYLLDFY